MAWQIGVDVGGTFTDLLALDPERGVFRVIDREEIVHTLEHVLGREVEQRQSGRELHLRPCSSRSVEASMAAAARRILAMSRRCVTLPPASSSSSSSAYSTSPLPRRRGHPRLVFQRRHQQPQRSGPDAASADDLGQICRMAEAGNAFLRFERSIYAQLGRRELQRADCHPGSSERCSLSRGGDLPRLENLGIFARIP